MPNGLINHFKPVIFVANLLLCACGTDIAPGDSLEFANQGAHSAALSSDGQRAVIGAINHGGSLWDLGSSARKFDWNHTAGGFSTIAAAAFSPSANFALSADAQTLVLWDAASGAGLRYWAAPDRVLSVDLSPSGEFALLGMENFTAVLFDVRRGGVKRVFNHGNRVRSVALSNDGKLALSGSEDQTAKLWDVQSGKLLHTMQHAEDVRLVALAPQADLAFSVSKYDKAVLWKTVDGEAVGELPLRSFALQRGLTFTAAVFSNDSTQLLTGTSDRIVQLWDTRSLQELQRWTVSKRKAWKPTSAAILALAFGTKPNEYHALASNGFAHKLKR
ncbi:MAG: WD40 repeat domain-containing protein [Pseudomonadales bacterium]